MTLPLAGVLVMSERLGANAVGADQAQASIAVCAAPCDVTRPYVEEDSGGKTDMHDTQHTKATVKNACDQI